MSHIHSMTNIGRIRVWEVFDHLLYVFSLINQSNVRFYVCDVEIGTPVAGMRQSRLYTGDLDTNERVLLTSHDEESNCCCADQVT